MKIFLALMGSLEVFCVVAISAADTQEADAQKEDKVEQPSSISEIPRRLLSLGLPIFHDVRDIFEYPEIDFPVYDQGRLNSCTVNAIVGAIQFDSLRRGLPHCMPSRLFIYYNGRASDDKNKDTGLSVFGCIRSLRNYGFCDEVMWPYKDGPVQFSKKPPLYCYGVANQEKGSKDLHFSAVKQDLSAIRFVLAQDIPIIAVTRFYPSFEDKTCTKRGRVLMPEFQKGDYMRSHAVIIVGYDDYRKLFIIRSSGGVKEGDEGHYYFPYNYIIRPDLTRDLMVIV